MPLQEGTWLTLEDGIQIHFQSPSELEDASRDRNAYRTGDYWLIPARTVTGDVEWPGEVGEPQAQPPHGIDHHYAPLAIFENGALTDCRCSFEPISTCPATSDEGSSDT